MSKEGRAVEGALAESGYREEFDVVNQWVGTDDDYAGKLLQLEHEQNAGLSPMIASNVSRPINWRRFKKSWCQIPEIHEYEHESEQVRTRSIEFKRRKSMECARRRGLHTTVTGPGDLLENEQVAGFARFEWYSRTKIKLRGQQRCEMASNPIFFQTKVALLDMGSTICSSNACVARIAYRIEGYENGADVASARGWNESRTNQGRTDGWMGKEEEEVGRCKKEARVEERRKYDTRGEAEWGDKSRQILVQTRGVCGRGGAVCDLRGVELSASAIILPERERRRARTLRTRTRALSTRTWTADASEYDPADDTGPYPNDGDGG
ncbi:hypothetical protein C8R44DRAFT_946497 [Mycena epipterygia]|nr:hypothetical protein C8R44DRAFT_946497 [Mycena epipterygia]